MASPTNTQGVGIMTSSDIQESVYQWASEGRFDAPYGVLTGDHVNTRGKAYKTVTFGRASTLDVTVEIYNRNFIMIKSSRHGRIVYRSFEGMMTALQDFGA